MRFLVHWLTTTLALAVAVWILPGLRVSDWWVLFIAALVLGLVNAIVRPILVILTLPITILTLGLFYLLVNGVAFALAAWVVPGFDVGGFWWAVLGALVVGLISWFIGMFTREPAREPVHRR
jgi:putative membrane protein